MAFGFLPGQNRLVDMWVSTGLAGYFDEQERLRKQAQAYAEEWARKEEQAKRENRSADVPRFRTIEELRDFLEKHYPTDRNFKK
jgi:hypothetical protein